MHRLHPVSVGLALMLFLAVLRPVGGQSNLTVSVDRLDSGPDSTMHAYVTVRDENGVPMEGLTSANFTIVEDQRTSVPPDTVVLQTNPDAPLAVAVVIDLSGHMRGRPLAEAKAASQQLLDALLGRPNDLDRVAFFGINSPVNVSDLAVHENAPEMGFTSDRDGLLNLINRLDVKDPQSTPLYDALFRVIKITAGQTGPRAIIVITDGQDPHVSSLSADDPISEANRNNIPIFPIGFSESTVDDAYLTRLAARTGGTYAPAREAAQFTQVFQDTLARLKQQYVLTYQSRLERDTQPHAVIVQVSSPKGAAYNHKIFSFAGVPAALATPAPPGTAVATAGAPETPLAASTGTVATTVAPAQAGMPQPGPTPVATKAPVTTTVADWVGDRENLPILIGIVVALLALLGLALWVVLRRERTGAAANNYSAPGGGLAGTPSNEAKTTIDRGTARPLRPGSTSATATEPTSGGISPTEYSGPAGWGQPDVPPAAPPPAFGPPPPVEATVILQRGANKALAVLVNRQQSAQRYDVTPNTTIGRAAENSISIAHATVSRQHARIKLEQGEFRLFDLGSANGTTVNGQRVLEPVVLKDGDDVCFGDVEFLFRVLMP